MLKRILSFLLMLLLLTGLVACKGGNSETQLPKYSQKEFGIAGFWAPYDISEEGLKQYKEAGLNTLLMVNHAGERTSKEQFYLGSERTMTTLENCKKVGLKAIISYNDWVAASCEGEGSDYYGETPFSKFDIYGDYKDIITGVHIVDEPKTIHLPIYGNQTLIEDFKKIYPNALYIANLLPLSAGVKSYGYVDYDDMLNQFEENFMKPFDKPYISVDVYPFHIKVPDTHLYLAQNYQMIAECAKKYDATKAFILQASTGSEFEDTLTEGDMRWQVNAAVAFGADEIQYYCYSSPYSLNDNGEKEHRYNYCMLNSDNTPSDVYYYVQKVNKEIQNFASVILSYDWDDSLGIEGSEESSYRLSSHIYDETYTNKKEFKDAKHYVSSTATKDLLVSRFESEQYGEGYMLVNFAKRDQKNSIEVIFKDCDQVAIYGGVDYSGTPDIVSLDENGKLKLELQYGEGVFVTPIV
ncbi:MAG: hypothetical protein E7521_08010 [Ruminococcaceae bacterium]|nr:hypothetical protein [Oscillospiraceae bacterium]